jgi:hypothetical protein
MLTFQSGALLSNIGILMISASLFSVALDMISKDSMNRLFFLTKILAMFIGIFWVLEHYWLSFVLSHQIMTTLINFVMFLMIFVTAGLGIAFLEENNEKKR